MRKLVIPFGVLAIVVLGFSVTSVQGALTDFSGVWVLDKGKTRGLPHGLKTYTMNVNQNPQDLVVETKVEGDLGGPEYNSSVESANPHATGRGGGGYIISTTTSGGFSAGSLALTMVNPKVVYPLDGRETTAPWGATGVDARLKAKWSKDGKTLDLSIVQQSSSGDHATMLTDKERWTLSKDGDVLKVQRSLSTAEGSDSVVLVFRKRQGEPPKPQP
jgi:hypothetical protein